MDLKSPLVLVTGATSPAGRKLVEALASGLPGQPELSPTAGLRIRCLALPGEDFAALRAISDRVQILVGDLRQPANAARLCHGAKGAILFHLALARERPLAGELRAINVNATTSLLELAAQAGVRRAVVLSDAAVCAGAPAGKALDEAVPAAPLTAFGRGLQAREAAVRAAKGLETVLLRAAPLIAPVAEGLRPIWFETALADAWPAAAQAAGPLSLATVATVAQACLRAAISKSAVGEVYWVADEPPQELAPLVRTLRQLAAAEPPAMPAGSRGRGSMGLKVWTGRLLGALGLGSASGDEAVIVARPLTVTTAKARKQIGLQPTGDLTAALRELLQVAPPPVPVPPAAPGAPVAPQAES